MFQGRTSIQGRGTAVSLPNRFERARYVPNPDGVDVRDDSEEPDPLPRTQLLPDRTKNIITISKGCFAPFEASINPYRGCEHGCIYCFARPTHEYLSLSSGLDFETKILIKHNAPELLRKALASPKWKPQLIACPSATDCYQPIERKLQLTRRCLEVLLDFRNPVGITTKNHLITRDIDILTQLHAFGCVQIFISVTTLDRHITQIMEPRTSTPTRRLDAIHKLSSAGIPVGVFIAPVIPALTDHEIPQILEAVKDAGAQFAGFDTVRLPHGVKDLFANWLDTHFPDRKEKVLNRLRAIRGNSLNGRGSPNEDLWANQLRQLFKVHAKRLGLSRHIPPISAVHFRRPPRPLQEGDQLSLFETRDG